MLQSLEQRSVDERSVEYRGARLAALQTGVLTACTEWDLRPTLTFHHLIAEARAMSTGLEKVAKAPWDEGALAARTPPGDRDGLAGGGPQDLAAPAGPGHLHLAGGGGGHRSGCVAGP